MNKNNLHLINMNQIMIKVNQVIHINVKVISNNKQGQYNILNKVNHFFQILTKAEEVSLEENSVKKNIK